MGMWDGLVGAIAPSWLLRAGRQDRKKDSIEQKLARLAAWPRLMPVDMTSLVREILEYSAAVFEAPRALVAWEEADEPWVRLGTIIDGHLRLLEESPAKYDPLVDESLWGLSFYSSDAASAAVNVSRSNGTGLQTRQIRPLHDGLRRDYGIGSVLCLKIDGETVQGHLLILDIASPSTMDFALGETMAALIAARLDQLSFRLAQRDAVNEERVRVARDLHDGLLQSFTGVVLQLETVHELVEKSPEEARRTITQLQGLIMSEQRELRAYVDELRPRGRHSAAEFDFRGRLAEFRERFRSEWRADLKYDIGSMSPLVADSLGQETFRLIYEAATNSAKHGQATEVDVDVFTSDDRLRIVVSDNGVGFPFRGRFNLNELRTMNQAPVSLGDRVSSLNGEMTIQSSDAGARLEISIPLGLRGA